MELNGDNSMVYHGSLPDYLSISFNVRQPVAQPNLPIASSPMLSYLRAHQENWGVVPIIGSQGGGLWTGGNCRGQFE